MSRSKLKGWVRQDTTPAGSSTLYCDLVEEDTGVIMATYVIRRTDQLKKLDAVVKQYNVNVSKEERDV